MYPRKFPFSVDGQSCNFDLRVCIYFLERYPEFIFVSLSIKDLTESKHDFDSPRIYFVVTLRTNVNVLVVMKTFIYTW